MINDWVCSIQLLVLLSWLLNVWGGIFVEWSEQLLDKDCSLLEQLLMNELVDLDLLSILSVLLYSFEINIEDLHDVVSMSIILKEARILERNVLRLRSL